MATSAGPSRTGSWRRGWRPCCASSAPRPKGRPPWKRCRNRRRGGARLTEVQPDHILLLDRELRIEYVNYPSPGLTVEDLLGTPLYTYVEEARQSEIKAILEGVLTTGQPARYETEFHGPNGTIYYESLCVPRVVAGQIEGLVLTARDITERKKIAAALRLSEAFYREAQRVAHIGHWELIPEIGTPTWSDEIFHIFGLDPHESEPSFAAHRDLLHPDDWPILNEAVTRASTEGTPFDIEFRLLRPDGEIHWMGAKGRTKQDDQGRVTRLFGTAQDITERKRVEAELQASLRDKEVLLQEVHHRVKNNLQIISSLLDLQADAIPDPRVQQALENSKYRIRSMAMVHETLYQSPDLARLNLADYLRDLADYLLGAYQGATGVLALEVQVEDVPLALDQAISCGLIVTELVSNALKHAFPLAGDNERPAGRRGKLWVVLRAHAGQVELVVGDDGAGLPADLDPQNTRSLGLRLVQLLARQIGGRLEVNRTEGVEFKIVFPAPDHEQGRASKRSGRQGQPGADSPGLPLELGVE